VINDAIAAKGFRSIVKPPNNGMQATPINGLPLHWRPRGAPDAERSAASYRQC
jgi:hypothetical protein